MDLVDKIMAYEDGDMEEEEVIRFFGELISTGMIDSLQGSYGRTAKALVQGGYLTPQGEVIS